MNTLCNLSVFKAVGKTFESPKILSSVCLNQNRSFAGVHEEVKKPKKYLNVFNKRVSKCGRYTFYSVFPHDYNEPWPFPPVYNPETGDDLNIDPVWGNQGEAPPSSITGKPKRALGHYPWLGRPIVPLNDTQRYFMDDQIAPYPFFRIGTYATNKTFWWQWAFGISVFLFIWWYVDHYYRPTVSLTYQRDELWYKERMAEGYYTWMPLAGQYYCNPLSPIIMNRADKDRWLQIGNYWCEFRFDDVFVPAAPEDTFQYESMHHFDPNRIKNPKIYNVERTPYGVSNPTMY